MVELPMGDCRKRYVSQVGRFDCVGFHTQSLMARGVGDTARRQTVSSHAAELATVGDRDSSAVVVQNHCQACRSAFDYRELVKDGHSASNPAEACDVAESFKQAFQTLVDHRDV